MDRAHESAWTASPSTRMDPRAAPACAACGSFFDLRAYGAALFCRDCREMAEDFYRKDLYCDLGGGD